MQDDGDASPSSPRMIKKTIRITAPAGTVWAQISDLIGLPAWADSVQDVTYIKGCNGLLRRGVGTARLITFHDGSRVEEHVILWSEMSQFTYVASWGLPVSPYVATISIHGISKSLTEVAWQSFLGSGKLSTVQFNNAIHDMEAFYERSLANLKALIEGGAGKAAQS